MCASDIAEVGTTLAQYGPGINPITFQTPSLRTDAGLFCKLFPLKSEAYYEQGMK